MRRRAKARGGVWGRAGGVRGRAAARSGAPDDAFQREHPRTRASWPQHQRLPLLLPPLLVGLLAPLVVVVVVAVATAVVVVLLIALVLAVLAALVSRYVQPVEEVAALHDLVVLRPAQLLSRLHHHLRHVQIRVHLPVDHFRLLLLPPPRRALDLSHREGGEEEVIRRRAAVLGAQQRVDDRALVALEPVPLEVGLLVLEEVHELLRRVALLVCHPPLLQPLEAARHGRLRRRQQRRALVGTAERVEQRQAAATRDGRQLVAARRVVGGPVAGERAGHAAVSEAQRLALMAQLECAALVQRR